MRRAERPAIGLEVSGLLSPNPTGIGVYGRRLGEALLACGGFDYVLLHPFSRRRRRTHLPRWKAPVRSYLDGRRLRRSVALVHALDSRLPGAYRGPLIGTIYDVLAALPITREKDLSPRRFQAKKLASYAEILRRADCVIAISAATRAALLEIGTPRGRVEVIPPGIDPPGWLVRDEPAPVSLASFGIRPPYLLAVGALCPRKNIAAVVGAFRAALAQDPDLRLVVAGEPSFGWEGSRDQDALRGLGERAVLTGYLPRDALWEAYRRARALVYLSHHEGFGLPVVEALATGSPVLASRRGGIPEAAGGMAVLVDPDDEGAVARGISLVLSAEAATKETVARRREHAAGFRWSAVAAKVLQIYRDVLAARRDRSNPSSGFVVGDRKQS